MKEHKIPTQTIDTFFSDLPNLYTVFTMYYPETISAYEPYLFMIETDFEDFIIDIFSELPTTSWYFKVGKYLFMYIYPIKELIRLSSYYGDVENLHIPLILSDLAEKGIITYSAHGILEAYCQKDK